MQVHLAACVLDGGEPLGLEYLESALEEDGHEVFQLVGADRRADPDLLGHTPGPLGFAVDVDAGLPCSLDGVVADDVRPDVLA